MNAEPFWLLTKFLHEHIAVMKNPRPDVVTIYSTKEGTTFLTMTWLFGRVEIGVMQSGEIKVWEQTYSYTAPVVRETARLIIERVARSAYAEFAKQIVAIPDYVPYVNKG